MKKKICFVAQNAYPVLEKRTDTFFIGGAEVQQLFIAQELVRRGYEVSFITMDHGQKIKKCGDFKIIPSFEPDEGIEVIRFFYPRLWKIWKALILANADIYYVRCAGFILGVVVFFASLYNKKVVYNGANNSDFLKHGKFPTIRDKFLFQWGLKRSNAIVLQNLFQERTLKENFGLNGHIIHNGLPEIKDSNEQKRETILWAGTDKKVKQPELFISLAKMFPNERFVMVGGIVQSNKIKEYEKCVPNLKLMGMLPFEETENQFKMAKLFISTSILEGFPNTYLQAWRRGIPVVSFMDPDSLMAKHSLGVSVNTFPEMIEKTRMILNGEIKFSHRSIQNYFNEVLTIEKKVNDYEQIFKLINGEKEYVHEKNCFF